MRVERKRAKGRRRRIFPFILIFIAVVLAIMVYDSNTRIVTTEYELFYPNLPASFDGFRIVVLADIHAVEFGRDNVRLIAEVEAAKPDIIAIAGDFIHYSRLLDIETQLERAETLIKGLTPIAPIYYITGNHEWDRRIGGPWSLISMLEEHGVNVLRNRYTRL